MPNIVKKGNPKANQRTKGNKKGRNWPQMADQLEGHHKLAPYYKSGPYYKYLSGNFTILIQRAKVFP